VCGGFAGQNVTTTGFSLVLRIFPVGIILPMLHAGLHITTTLIRRTSGQSLGSINEGNAARHFGEQMAESFSITLFFKGLSSSM